MSEEDLRHLLDEAAGDPGRPDLHSLLGVMRRRRLRRRVAARGTAAVAILTVGAIVVTGSLGSATAARPKLKLAADLTTYSSCDTLLTDLQARAMPLVGAYGYTADQQLYAGRLGEALAGSTAAGGVTSATSASTTPGPQAAPAQQVALPHSSTTDRTSGVDEPDITKTDGRLFLSLRQGVLRVYDAVNPALLGSVTLGDTSSSRAYAGTSMPTPEFLLDGTRAVVTNLAPLVTRQGDTRGTTTTAVVDLSDPTHPTVTRELTIDGDLIDARLIDDLPRLVVHAAPPLLRWFSPADSSAAAAAEAKDRNQQLLRASTIADWLPTYALTDGAGKDLGHGQLFGCDAVERDTAPSDGADLVGVTAFNPAAATAPTGGLAVVGAGNTAYAVGEHLWIATGQHGGGFDGGVTCYGGTFCPTDATGSRGAPSTQVHGFDLSDPAHTTELASTTLTGGLHGDDALNEENGVLSVLLSTGGPESGQATQDTTLLDFRLGAGTLTQIGTLDDLSTGETLQSARWIGTFAYLVTFKAIDPLLVIDLSNPAAPRLRASLPSADTSTYLLQSDTGRLLGIGNAGSATALKLYDVDNADAPTILATAKVAGGSAAGSDPHALLYWRAGRLLFLPSYDGKVSVTTVGRDTLTAAFTISQAAHPGRADDQIDRAVLIGHNAWTVSDRGVLVTNLAGGADVAWLPS